MRPSPSSFAALWSPFPDGGRGSEGSEGGGAWYGYVSQQALLYIYIYIYIYIIWVRLSSSLTSSVFQARIRFNYIQFSHSSFKKPK